MSGFSRGTSCTGELWGDFLHTFFGCLHQKGHVFFVFSLQFSFCCVVNPIE